MFQFKNKVIKMTRGDSGRLKVDLKSSSGAPYVMREGDTLTLTVRKSVKSEVLMQVVSTTNAISITPADSKKLVVGNCVYDIELRTASGDVFTILGLDDSGDKNMTVYAEVTE